MIKVNGNYSQSYTGINAQRTRRQAPSFQGSYTEQIANGLHHAKTIKFMKSLEWLKGEIGGILITALGTGLVAPIFIGFNPFVKPPKDATPEQKEENKNTKLYTAMRQPISAVLAIIFQASVQKYIDKGLDFVVNNPEISKFARANIDQQEINTKTYIQSKVKQEMAQNGKTKPSWFSSLFNKDAKEKREAYQTEFNSRVKEIQTEQLNKVARKFQESGKISIGERQLDFKSTAELVNKQIDSYISDAKSLRKTPEAIGRYLDRAEVLTANEDHLREIFDGITKDTPKEQVTSKVQDLLSKEKNDDVKKLLQEILDRPEDLRGSRINRTLARIDSIKNMCNGKFSRGKYRSAMLDRNKVLADRIVELTAAKIKDPKVADQNIIQTTIDKVVAQCHFKNENGIIQSVLHDTDTFDHNLKGLKNKVYDDITKGYKKLVEHNYKSWNQFTKIGVGVFITLPITCTALNWVYPRFMDIFFPKLSGKKEAQDAKKIGGNK
jgi:hypothetical protein